MNRKGASRRTRQVPANPRAGRSGLRAPISDSSRPGAAPEADKAQPPYFSVAAFALGLIGALLLSLAFSWSQGPPPQRNTDPRQLREPDKSHFMLAIAMEHEYRSDPRAALDKLIALGPAVDPLQALADAACALARDGYARTQSGLNALRMAANLYRPQGRSGCAEALLPGLLLQPAPKATADAASKPVATLAPSKTPFLSAALPTATRRAIATPVPQRAFTALPARTFCDRDAPAVIEVYTVDYLGRPIPGQRIRLRWGDHEDIFVTGLKSERGPAYADFQMAEDTDYVIDMPGAADPLRATLSTGTCYTAAGQTSLKSFRVTFRAGA